MNRRRLQRLDDEVVVRTVNGEFACGGSVDNDQSMTQPVIAGRTEAVGAER